MALLSKGKEVFGCPMDGEVRPLSETPDRAFADGLLGDGVVIFPSGDKVFALSAAKVNFTFPTRHAVGLETKSGYEYLIHVGINTNQLK
ncbi:PTS glucose transporter subunit IIA, partial [Anaerostipes caccae]|uniref:PTS glucose transporter subunit IIA n=1 Tax=Anaerostipes caccae TaxID=105841 RepID=UPI00210C05B2